jgi:hypothetical protein
MIYNLHVDNNPENLFKKTENLFKLLEIRN